MCVSQNSVIFRNNISIVRFSSRYMEFIFTTCNKTQWENYCYCKYGYQVIRVCCKKKNVIESKGRRKNDTAIVLDVCACTRACIRDHSSCGCTRNASCKVQCGTINTGVTPITRRVNRDVLPYENRNYPCSISPRPVRSPLVLFPSPASPVFPITLKFQIISLTRGAGCTDLPCKPDIS